MADWFAERTGIAVQLDASFNGRLSDECETQLFRIAQEALTNALRHSHARVVKLGLATDGDRLRLEIRDDGCGFDPTRRRTTALGLLSMEERALALGGRLEVTSVPDEGTAVVLDCPIVERPAAGYTRASDV